MKKRRYALTPQSQRRYEQILSVHLRGDRLKDIDGLANSTRQVLISALKWKGRDDLADRIEMGPKKRKDLEVPDEEHVAALKKHLKKLETPRGELLTILVSLGLRSFELLALERAQVEAAVKTGRLRVVRKGDYTTDVATGDVARECLRDLLKVEGRRGRAWWRVSELVTYKPTGKKAEELNRHHIAAYMTLRNWTREACDQAFGEKRSPHFLRHIFATHLLRKGAEVHVVQKAMGHVSPTMTLRYAHATADEVRGYLD